MPCQLVASEQIIHPWWKRGQQTGDGTAWGGFTLGTAAHLLDSSWGYFPVLLLAQFERTRQWEGAPACSEPPAPGMLLALHPHKPLGKALPPKTSVGRQEKWGSLDQKFLAEEGSQAGGWGLGQTQ